MHIYIHIYTNIHISGMSLSGNFLPEETMERLNASAIRTASSNRSSCT
jgi:hypothetical protein